MDLLWKIFTKFARERRETGTCRTLRWVDQDPHCTGHSSNSCLALGVPDLLAYGNGCTCAVTEDSSAVERRPHF
jgi:hypothetical protein